MQSALPCSVKEAAPVPPDEPWSLRARPLPAPAELRRGLPVPPEIAAGIAHTRTAISDVLHGRDGRRLVIVVGPCSIHDPDAALRYADRLGALARDCADAVVVVMRSYFEKPRSEIGWKGFLNDPDLDGRCDPVRGLAASRALLLEIARRGVACATELLDPAASPYLEDLLAWAAIGARTAASQPHRELASGLALPVGFKNTLDGDVEVAIQGALAASSPHTRLGIDDCGRAAAIRCDGNPDAHVVLRGGGGRSNHDAPAVAEAARRATRLGLARPLLVDCSHANSGKDHRRQGAAFREVLAQVRGGRREIAGLLLESHLRAGRQDLRAGRRPRPDRSITDACIGWEETQQLLQEAVSAVRAVRQ